jgi:release factor glutamine methyltransferase
MRKFFKRFISLILIPTTRWYLRKERTYTYLGATVRVLPGVFHPGLFYSTKFLIDFLITQPIRGKSLLELGCGTGLISVIAAKRGAIVTASDLSQAALNNTSANIKSNKVPVDVIHSDVFSNLGEKIFDWIVINPPYYAKTPSNESELAWHCGEHFEYFEKLFKNLRHHIHSQTNVIMVLTLGCDLRKIFFIARNLGFEFELIEERNVFFDGKDFLYRIKSKN